MADKAQPEFYGDAPSGGGQKVPHGAGRAARLEAAGIAPAKTLDEFWREKADQAFTESGSQEDAGAEFQKVSSKQGRGNVEMPTKDILEHAQELARQSGRPISSSGLVQEPVTEKTVEGHSAEKKEALKVMKKEGVSIHEAIKMVRGESTGSKKSSKKKGD